MKNLNKSRLKPGFWCWVPVWDQNALLVFLRLCFLPCDALLRMLPLPCNSAPHKSMLFTLHVSGFRVFGQVCYYYSGTIIWNVLDQVFLHHKNEAEEQILKRSFEYCENISTSRCYTSYYVNSTQKCFGCTCSDYNTSYSHGWSTQHCHRMQTWTIVSVSFRLVCTIKIESSDPRVFTRSHIDLMLSWDYYCSVL